MAKSKFPPLCILTPDMAKPQLTKVINRAFGGDAVKSLRNKDGKTTISIKQDNEQRKDFWIEFYDALEELGSVYIESYIGDEEFTHGHIEFSKEAKEGYWEVRLSKRSDGFRETPVNPVKCTCACTCGAGR